MTEPGDSFWFVSALREEDNDSTSPLVRKIHVENTQVTVHSVCLINVHTKAPSPLSRPKILKIIFQFRSLYCSPNHG